MVIDIVLIDKTTYYCVKIKDNNSNQKELFRISNDILHKSKSHPLPTHNDPQEVADEFADYFHSTINQIHHLIHPVIASPDSKDGANVSVFDSFLLTTENKLTKIIMDLAEFADGKKKQT